MEAFGSAHRPARRFNALRIAMRLLPAAYVRTYVKRNETDTAEACALREAARYADISRVRVKAVAQQALQGQHRTRSLWMATRTSRGNASRGLCREFSVEIAHGSRPRVEQIARVPADSHSVAPDLIPASPSGWSRRSDCSARA
jgi:transposase